MSWHSILEDFKPDTLDRMELGLSLIVYQSYEKIREYS